MGELSQKRTGNVPVADMCGVVPCTLIPTVLFAPLCTCHLAVDYAYKYVHLYMLYYVHICIYIYLSFETICHKHACYIFVFPQSEIPMPGRGGDDFSLLTTQKELAVYIYEWTCRDQDRANTISLADPAGTIHRMPGDISNNMCKA
jgi:hypothetical protein